MMRYQWLPTSAVQGLLPLNIFTQVLEDAEEAGLLKFDAARYCCQGLDCVPCSKVPDRAPCPVHPNGAGIDIAIALQWDGAVYSHWHACSGLFTVAASVSLKNKGSSDDDHFE